MSYSFYYLANGKMYKYAEGKAEELSSGVLSSYYRKVRDAAARNEWKYKGSGAEFTGTYRPATSPEDSVKAVYSRVNCIGQHDGNVIYSIDIDSTSGVYRKYEDGGDSEGIVLSSATTAYRDFDIKGELMVTSAAFAGESNIAVKNLATGELVSYTEGHTVDSQPVWSRAMKNRVYFACSGLPEAEMPTPDHRAQPMNYNDMVNEMYMSAEPELRGPSSICLLDVERVTLDEVLSDDAFDFVHPFDTPDGSLYYIKRPYAPSKQKEGSLGCLVDLLLFPVRIIGALFGFLNVFSAKYSGKTLSRSNVKERDEGQMMIDGNLINAERELRAQEKRGDKNPGIIPRSWELRKRTPSGEDVLVRRGVVAYKVTDDGTLLISNGSAIIELTEDGKERRLADARGVVLIK